MKKVYLFCSAGMSTSMLAKKMQDVANSFNIPLTVKAFSESKIGDIINGDRPDCILLGPQVKYIYEDVVEKYGNLGIPIEVIDQTAYGIMDAETVLKRAIILIKNNK